MSKLAHYPPWRRIALQTTMWVTFAASLGTAALVSAHLRRGGVTFDRAIACGQYTVNVPAGWKTVDHAGVGMMIVESNEVHRPAGSKRQPRRLIFVGRTVAADESPDDVLQGEPSLQIGDGGLGSFEPEVTSTLAGSDADVYVRSSGRIVGLSMRIPTADYAAAVVQPDGAALAVKMTCDGVPDGDDLTFFRTVLSNAELRR